MASRRRQKVIEQGLWSWSERRLAMDLQDPVRKLGRLDEHLKSVQEAQQAALDIAEEREQERNTPRRVYDSGWYQHNPGDPLPDIETFRIKRR